MRLKYVFAAVLFAVAVGASSAWAGIWEYKIEKDLALYGHIDQRDARIVNGNVACGPTATINSFIYLQNKYGYGLDVNSADPYADVNELGVLMGLGAGGVSDVGFIAGKREWLRLYGNGKYYEVHQAANPALGGVIPTWDFIYNELRACEDVEIGFAWDPGSGGHVVTATSFSFDDTDNDLFIDPNETALLDFIDPWGGVEIPPSRLTMGADGYLYLSYVGGGAGRGATGRIIMVAAESPIPEPATIIVWGLLGMLAAGFLYRRQRRAA